MSCATRDSESSHRRGVGTGFRRAGAGVRPGESGGSDAVFQEVSTAQRGVHTNSSLRPALEALLIIDIRMLAIRRSDDRFGIEGIVVLNQAMGLFEDFRAIAPERSRYRGALVAGAGQQAKGEVDKQRARFRALHLRRETVEDDVVDRVETHPDRESCQDARHEFQAVDHMGDDGNVNEREREVQDQHGPQAKRQIPPHDRVHGAGGAPRAAARHYEENHPDEEGDRGNRLPIDLLPGTPLLMNRCFHTGRFA